mgnify:CR=1 FL=1
MTSLIASDPPTIAVPIIDEDVGGDHRPPSAAGQRPTRRHALQLQRYRPSVKHPPASPKDTIFQQPTRAEDFEFNDRVVEVFDDMLDRSIPFYKEVVVSTARLLTAHLGKDDKEKRGNKNSHRLAFSHKKSETLA